MLKIGDFSKVAQVSVKTLRHYAKLGLLKPAWIDRFTGYRYYTLDQLHRLNRILALKDLGFSLEQIRVVLKKDVPTAELQGMLRMKRAELERQIHAEQARLARVEARLRQIEQEGRLPGYEVLLKAVPPQSVLGVRDRLPTYAAVGALFDELHAYLEAQRVPLDVTCPCIALYYDKEYREHTIDVEAAVVVTRSLPLAPRFALHTLPGVETMASLVVPGGVSDLPGGYEALMGWMESNGYGAAGPNREVYLQDAEAGQIVEIQFPVQRKVLKSFAHSTVTVIKESHAMQPEIVTKPAFTVVGLKYHGDNQNQEIAAMWGVFNTRIPEIMEAASGIGNAYGVCNETDAEGAFDYLAGFEVESAERIPEGMEQWQVPAQTYAVFPCKLADLHATYSYAFETWLPASGYRRAEGPDFEYYGEEFDPRTPEEGLMYVYIPVEPAGKK